MARKSSRWRWPVRRHGRAAIFRCALLALCFGIAAARTGVAIDLSDFRGRVVYLDFWASWCAPCRQSFPWMQQMQDAYRGRGLVVVAVGVDRKRRDADRFLANLRPTFEVDFDPEGVLAERFGVKGMPTGLVIDRHGVVRFTHIGFRPEDSALYEQQLEQALNE
jgi:cytochrome c biogenesis protein CcmG, thiol:disulfide interchange protein DsbE